MGALKDRIPAGPRFEREFPGDESWKRFKMAYGAESYYSGPGIRPFSLKVRFTLPENFVMAEQIHHSGEQVRGEGKGQRCTRCGLMLVLWPETAFAPDHDIYVDTRNPGSQFGFGMCNIMEPVSPEESRYFESLPKCKPEFQYEIRGPHDGEYLIFDKMKDCHIAVCWNEEDAQTVFNALNSR